MNYVKGIKIGGATAAQIPCIPGRGAPTTETKGAVGCLYMDKDTGAMYKCTAVNVGIYTWVPMGDAGAFYHTTREETSITTADEVYALYDALKAQFPEGRVVKKEYTVGDFTNYVYEISTGEYSTEGAYINRGNDPYIKKPKFLVLSAIHGEERKTAFSTYRFIRDVLNGHNIPQAFREGAIISVMPVGTPSAFDAYTRKNANGVDINRDFASATPQAETQAIKNWLAENGDAEVFVDLHNNGALNEKVVIVGLPDNSKSNNARKIALRGVDKVIPYWRDVIGYPLVVEANGFNEDGTGEEVKERKVIFSYSSTVENDGMAKSYAQNVVGITSLTVEIAAFYGSHTEWGGHTSQKDSPEAVAMGAEALGNILIEFYENEVSNMADIDNKLNTLIEQVNSNYHAIPGTFIPDSDLNTLNIPCEPGAKHFTLIAADLDSLSPATSSRMPIRVISSSAFYQNFGVKGGSYVEMNSPNSSKPIAATVCPFDNSNGISIKFTDEALVLDAGKAYNWTAHYWNE